MDAFGDAEAALGAGSDFGSILGALRMCVGLASVRHWQRLALT